MSRPIIHVLVLLLAMPLYSCGANRQTLQLQGSDGVPAAQSTVKVETTDNGNTRIDLRVRHLAEPQRVDAGARVFVVWARPLAATTPITNLGALTVDEDLEGRLITVTPLRAFDLVITAEPSQQVTAPTGRELLTTRVETRPPAPAVAP